MLQRNSLRLYWKLFILVAMVSAVIFFNKSTSVRADGCTACDSQQMYCDMECETQFPPGSDRNNCEASCSSAWSGCIGTCLNYLNDYHFEDVDPNLEQEIALCKQQAHRAIYRQCMAGNPYYPDDYNICIPGGGLADDCCYAQEFKYDLENCW